MPVLFEVSSFLKFLSMNIWFLLWYQIQLIDVNRTIDSKDNLFDGIIVVTNLISYVYCIVGRQISTMIFGLRHDSSRDNFHGFISDEDVKDVILIAIFRLRDIFGEAIKYLFDGYHLQRFVGDSDLKFLRRRKTRVLYTTEAVRSRFWDIYKDRYEKFYYHLTLDRRNLSQNDRVDNVRAQSSSNQVTIDTDQVVLTQENVPNQSVTVLDNLCTVPERSGPLFKHDPSVNKNDDANNHSALRTHMAEENDDCDNLTVHMDEFPTENVCYDKNYHNQSECSSTSCTARYKTEHVEIYGEDLNQNNSSDLITCSICAKQIERSKIHRHYLDETHQLVLIDVLSYLQSKKILQRNQEQKAQFLQAQDAISNLSNDVIIINNNIERINEEFSNCENSLQILKQESDSFRWLQEENENRVESLTAFQTSVNQEIVSLKHNIENGQVISFDGTLLWKIKDVKQKMDDAEFERQRSIYSPEFFSSTFGYKMCSRLFLNGVNNAYGTHLSIYFVLMRGEYDALLTWPFPFKVSFTLLDQSIPEENPRHFSKFFWPNITSICFQRPRTNMNEGYGIESFLPLEQFRENLDRYAPNDTMFIKLEIDFTSIPPKVPLNSGEMLENDEGHTDTNDDDLMRKFLFMIDNPNQVNNT